MMHQRQAPTVHSVRRNLGSFSVQADSICFHMLGHVRSPSWACHSVSWWHSNEACKVSALLAQSLLPIAHSQFLGQLPCLPYPGNGSSSPHQPALQHTRLPAADGGSIERSDLAGPGALTVTRCT